MVHLYHKLLKVGQSSHIQMHYNTIFHSTRPTNIPGVLWVDFHSRVSHAAPCDIGSYWLAIANDRQCEHTETLGNLVVKKVKCCRSFCDHIFVQCNLIQHMIVTTIHVTSSMEYNCLDSGEFLLQLITICHFKQHIDDRSMIYMSKQAV